MKVKLPVILITLFLILTLVPVAFAQDVVDDPVEDPVEDPVVVTRPDAYFCDYLEDGTDPLYIHPVAAGIVARYLTPEVAPEEGEEEVVDVPEDEPVVDYTAYNTVMTWFCVDKYGFGEIMLALETFKALEGTEIFADVDAIFDLFDGNGHWGDVWKYINDSVEDDDFVNGRPKTDEWGGATRLEPGTGGVGAYAVAGANKKAPTSDTTDDVTSKGAKSASQKGK
jgi:hypothetical protein